jgi:biotin synthase
MIEDAGFEIQSAGEPTLPRERHDLLRTRRRGAGTALPPNA